MGDSQASGAHQTGWGPTLTLTLFLHEARLSSATLPGPPAPPITPLAAPLDVRMCVCARVCLCEEPVPGQVCDLLSAENHGGTRNENRHPPQPDSPRFVPRQALSTTSGFDASSGYRRNSKSSTLLFFPLFSRSFHCLLTLQDFWPQLSDGECGECVTPTLTPKKAKKL